MIENIRRYFTLKKYLQQRGTSFVSIFRTSPTLQSKPLEMLDLIALIGGHKFPMAETFSRGSMTALAYGTERSKMRLRVEPQRSYNCGCRTAGTMTRTKSI